MASGQVPDEQHGWRTSYAIGRITELGHNLFTGWTSLEKKVFD